MKFGIPSDTKLWEAISALQILQALGGDEAVYCEDTDINDLFRTGNIPLCYSVGADRVRFAIGLADTYRKIDMAGKRPYVDLLEELLGFSKLKLNAPAFPLITPTCEKGPIIVAPFPVRADMGIPFSVWKSLVLHLRSYDRPVYQIGERGERQEETGYTESELLSELSIHERLSILASAELIVGVPNAWMWAATAWEKRMVVMYPDDVPIERWFPYGHANYGIMLYEKSRLQIPVILTALRQIISKL